MVGNIMQSIKRDEVLIEAADLKTKLDNPNLRLLDATVVMNQGDDSPSAQEIFTQKHIPGAVFFDHQAFSDPNGKYQLTLPSAAYLSEALGKIGIGNNSEVVVYSTGMLAWATRVWWLLKYAGHDNVRVLNGGLAAWEAAGGKVVTDITRYPTGTFVAKIQPGYFVNREGMEAALQSPDAQAVHSLPEAVYAEAHIPNSVCQPCTDFLDNGTALLPDDELKQKLVANHASGQTITYCGGGVAATVNAVVCRLVGNPNVAVYDGSMSEWVGDGMPVAKLNT